MLGLLVVWLAGLLGVLSCRRWLCTPSAAVMRRQAEAEAYRLLAEHFTRSRLRSLAVALALGAAASAYAGDPYGVYMWASVGAGGVSAPTITGGSPSLACSHVQAVQWDASSGGGVARYYTTLSGANCDVYRDSGRTDYWYSFAVSGPGDYAQTSGLSFFDGWCNSAESCAAAGYSGGGGGGSGGTVTLIVPDIFNIDAEGGTQIALAVIGLLTIGAIGRLLIRSSGGSSGASWSNDEPS